jgi:hypothetical protein
MWLILKKQLNQDIDADRLSVRVVGFMMMRAWFVTKYGVLCVVFYKIKGRKTRNVGKGRHLWGYNLNLTDGFTDEYYRRVYFLSNFVCNNDTIFFSFLYFQIYVIPLVLTDINFPSVNTNENIMLVNVIVIYQ